MRGKPTFTSWLLGSFNTSNDPLWKYEVISAQLYARHIMIFGSVQCWVNGEYILYELVGNELTYKARNNLNEKYKDTIGAVRVPRLFKKFRITLVLLLHKKLVESKYGI